MAYIDLKQCRFFLEDGYTATGAVNLMAGYAIGLSTMAVDLFTSSLIPGNIFTIAGDVTIYTIVSVTGSPTTSITFSPPLVAMAADDAVITVGPHVLEITIGDGNLTYDEKRALEYKLNRGLLDQVRLGDQAPIDVNFQFAWTFLTSKSGGTVPSFEEFIKRRGPAVAYTTAGKDCEPFAVNIVLEQSQPCASDDHPIERIVLPQFRHTSLNHDPKAGTVTCQGTCNATEALITRITASQEHN